MRFYARLKFDSQIVLLRHSEKGFAAESYTTLSHQGQFRRRCARILHFLVEQRSVCENLNSACLHKVSQKDQIRAHEMSVCVFKNKTKAGSHNYLRPW